MKYFGKESPAKGPHFNMSLPNIYLQIVYTTYETLYGPFTALCP